MRIRPSEAGDHVDQARIFNTVAATLPAFKPATADEVAQRSLDLDRPSTFIAIEGDEAVGYAVFNPNGRISYPWCLPGFEAGREPLLSVLIDAMTDRGLPAAWAAYRADWSPVLDFFLEHGFAQVREMVNFVAETSALPRTPVPPSLHLGPLDRDDLPRLLELGQGLFPVDDPDRHDHFFWENPFFGPDRLLGLRKEDVLVGATLVVVDPRFADPTKIDAAMPCFRLGALGTEHERHKRVNGLVSCVFTDETIGEALLAEAARQLEAAGIAHAAAQCPSDRPDLLAFYGRFFERQGAFPIVSRRLG